MKKLLRVILKRGVYVYFMQFFYQVLLFVIKRTLHVKNFSLYVKKYLNKKSWNNKKK